MSQAIKLFVKHPISDQNLASLQEKADAVFEDVVTCLSSDDLDNFVDDEIEKVIPEASDCST